MELKIANLAEFNRFLPTYAAVFTRKGDRTWQDAIKKQAGELAYHVNQAVKRIAPAKGFITSDLLAGLKRGRVPTISARARRLVFSRYNVAQDSSGQLGMYKYKKGPRFSAVVGGKRLNLQALLVRQTIRLRESAPGFLAQSIKYPKSDPIGAARNKHGYKLSIGRFLDNGSSFQFRWSNSESPLSALAAKGLSTSKGQQAIQEGIDAAKVNMLKYITDRIGDRINQIPK